MLLKNVVSAASASGRISFVHDSIPPPDIKQHTRVRFDAYLDGKKGGQGCASNCRTAHLSATADSGTVSSTGTWALQYCNHNNGYTPPLPPRSRPLHVTTRSRRPAPSWKQLVMSRASQCISLTSMASQCFASRRNARLRRGG